MKIVQKPVKLPHLIKINHTPAGADHPIKRRHPIKDSKYFRKKTKRSKK
jgi:hypothetical protein